MLIGKDLSYLQNVKNYSLFEQVIKNKNIATLAKVIPEWYARKFLLVPLSFENNILKVGGTLAGLAKIDNLALALKPYLISIEILTEKEILFFVEMIYHPKEQMKNIVINKNNIQFDSKKLYQEQEDNNSYVVQYLQHIIMEGHRLRASDIHIEPQANQVHIRFRIDGKCEYFSKITKEVAEQLIARIKILAHMNIAEKRKPQDGYFKFLENNYDLDIRISIIPALYAESVVMRIIDNDNNTFNTSYLFENLPQEKAINKLIFDKSSLLLVTGPTGSGKSTTMYAIANMLAKKGRKVVTIEDPIERKFPNLIQTGINVKSGLNYATTIRAMLRQDPDVILIGEIRDTETAGIAVRATLSGHKVIASLHTADSLSAITRLIDLDISRQLIASVLGGVISQRLIRRYCKCVSNLLEIDKNCPWCRGSGFYSRIAIFEVLEANVEVINLISEKYSMLEVKKILKQKGFKDLATQAKELVRQQKTSLAEISNLVYFKD